MAGKTNLGASVVPDLMRVYESLTQSSTPQDASASNAGGDSTNETQGRDDAIAADHSFSSTVSHQNPLPNGHADDSSNIPHINYHFYSSNHTQEFLPIAPRASSRPSSNIRNSSRKRSTEDSSLVQNSDASANSSKPKRKKKPTDSDGRWTKRFAWPDELHRDFVSAIFDVGLKNSSPSAILEQMPAHDEITSERIKSHLQKYRLHRSKHKNQFMESYDGALEKIQNGTMDSSSLDHAEAAAYLTHITMKSNDDDLGLQPPPDPNSLAQSGILQLPQLTEAEKRSPVGASMGYLMGLFFSLKQQLLNQRKYNEGGDNVSTKDNMEALGSFSSFPERHHSSQYDLSISVSQIGSSHQDQAHYANHQHAIGSPALTSTAPASEQRGNSTLMEENKMMKQEMRSQMSFQTKMRKLKEQELNKYKSDGTSSAPHFSSNPPAPPQSLTANSSEPHDLNGDRATNGGNNYRQSSVRKSSCDSIGNIDEDFWKSDQVLDDQLFEFLMND